MVRQAFESIDPAQITATILGFAPNIGVAFAILVAFWVLFRLTRPALFGVLRRAKFHDALIDLLVGSIYRYALLMVALIMALGQLGVNVAAALAGLGIAGIAIGFAAQDTVANMISGIMIFWDKPFTVGDWVEVEGAYGRVGEITLRSTRIRTPRNTWVVVPNKSIIDAVLENYSKRGEIRLDVPIGIAYKESIPEARRVILEALRDVEGLRSTPEPRVLVSDLGDSSVNLQMRVWVNDGAERETMTAATVEAAKLALDAAGIQIPYPHLQLFVDDVEDRVWQRAAGLGGGR